jgi:hypothetical protein
MPHRGIRTHNLSRRSAADLRPKPRGHWDRLFDGHMCYIWQFSPYRAVNKLRLGYKNRSVNAVQGNNRCSLSLNVIQMRSLIHVGFVMGKEKLVLFYRIHNHLPVKMETTECSETSAFNIQTPGKYPEENLPWYCFIFRIL